MKGFFSYPPVAVYHIVNSQGTPWNDVMEMIIVPLLTPCSLMFVSVCDLWDIMMIAFFNISCSG